MLAEQTHLSPEYLREKAGIRVKVLPAHLYSEFEYTKWGDIIQPNGLRIPGELFHDPSVQKVLKDVLYLYTPYVKYPRTYHLPWSPGFHTAPDDMMMMDLTKFYRSGIVATLKMDGENTTLYSDGYIHARSLW